MHGGLVPHRCSEQHPGDERRHVSRAVGPRHDRLSIHPGMLVASPRAAIHLFPREIPLHRGDLRFGRRFFVGALIDLDVPPPSFSGAFSASMLGYRRPPPSNERPTYTHASRRKSVIVRLRPVPCFDLATALATSRALPVRFYSLARSSADHDIDLRAQIHAVHSRVPSIFVQTGVAHHYRYAQ